MAVELIIRQRYWGQRGVPGVKGSQVWLGWFGFGLFGRFGEGLLKNNKTIKPDHCTTARLVKNGWPIKCGGLLLLETHATSENKSFHITVLCISKLIVCHIAQVDPPKNIHQKVAAGNLPRESP